MTIQAIDNFLPQAEQAALWNFLRGGGWSFGAFSADGGDRYFYKHYAGIKQSPKEFDDPAAVERELAQYPLIEQVWTRLKAGPLRGQRLGRCYANGMPAGTEGGVHLDSDVPDHYTAIYYPHPQWNADMAGETVFFNATRDEILGAVYPKPNRMVIFPGTIPHVARPMSSRVPDMRITLMFKTVGALAPTAEVAGGAAPARAGA
jgi:SM-20-related protein